MEFEDLDAFEGWLSEQPREVSVATAHRAALRVAPIVFCAVDLPLASKHRLVLATLRAMLISSVATVRPTDEIKSAAANAALAADVAANAADVAANAALAANAADVAALAAATLLRSIYADATIPAAELLTTAIDDDLSRAILDWAAGRENLLESGGPWAFWAEWYARAMAGEPLDWDLQEQIALIPYEVWDGDDAPEKVAAEIRKIEATHYAKALPQAEVLVQGADGRWDVQPDPSGAADIVASALRQAEFALNTALKGNSGFNTYSAAYEYLRYALDECRDDPNSLEQSFGIARRSLERMIASGELQPDERLVGLIESLQRHEIQMRASHKPVREAFDQRTKQAFREVPPETIDTLADRIDATDRVTADRLNKEMRLDAATIRNEPDLDAKAIAIRRVGGRAALIATRTDAEKAAAESLESEEKDGALKQIDETIQKVDASSPYKVVRGAGVFYAITDLLKTLFGF